MFSRADLIGIAYRVAKQRPYDDLGEMMEDLIRYIDANQAKLEAWIEPRLAATFRLVARRARQRQNRITKKMPTVSLESSLRGRGEESTTQTLGDTLSFDGPTPEEHARVVAEELFPLDKALEMLTAYERSVLWSFADGKRAKDIADKRKTTSSAVSAAKKSALLKTRRYARRIKTEPLRAAIALILEEEPPKKR